MKKVKTLLVTAVAALSLTSCNYQDAIDWAKNAGGQVGGFFTSLLEKVGLRKKEEKKEEPCQHEDKNHDGKCDLCGEEGLEVVHADENHDHKCDVCGEVLSTHSDADNDFKCDYCGEELATVDVRLDLTDAQLIFSQDEEFSAEGVKVIATSEVGSEKELEFTTSEPDFSEVGDKTVVVTYGEGENDKLEYTINVSFWSATDIAYLETLTDYDLTFLGYCGFPYLPGHNMKVELVLDEQQNLLDWYISAENVSEDEYLAFVSRIGDYKYSLGNAYFFEFLEDAADASKWSGLSDTVVFRLTPYELEGGYGYRLFLDDEYIVMGYDESGKVIIRNRMVNCELDAMFLGTNKALWRGWSEGADEILPYLPKIPYYYHSELSSLKFVLPEVTAQNGFYIYSYFTAYPFAESLDKYDLAMTGVIEGASDEMLSTFAADLVQEGFALQEPKEDNEGESVYLLNNELVGSIEYTLYPVEEGDLYFDIFYIAPAEYTTVLTEEINALLASLNTDDAKVDNKDYTKTSASIVSYSRAIGEEATLQSVFEAEGTALEAAGFEVTEAAKFDETTKVWSVELTNYSTLTLKVKCSESEGKAVFTVTISKYYSFEIADVVKAIFGSVTPSLSESGNYVGVVQAYGEEDPTAEGLLAVAQAIASSDALNAIYNRDALAQGNGYYIISGVTKDGKIAFTAQIYAGQNGYTVSLQVELMTEMEAFIRDLLKAALWTPKRSVNYFKTQTGFAFDVIEQYDYATEAADVLNYFYVSELLKMGFTVVDYPDDGLTCSLTNGKFDVSLSTYEYVVDESTTYTEIVCYVTAHVEQQSGGEGQQGSGEGQQQSGEGSGEGSGQESGGGN